MDTEDERDSLFGSSSSTRTSSAYGGEAEAGEQPSRIASREAPSIPGLFFFPELLSRSMHDKVLHQVAACGYFSLEDDGVSAALAKKGELGHDADAQDAYYRSPRNQAMLFARSLASHAGEQEGSDPHAQTRSGLPTWAVELIQHLGQTVESLPEHELPLETKELLFPRSGLLSRQLILNLYRGGEGLASHVDLVNRFADGILLCSLGPSESGTVMEFTSDSDEAHRLFLPSGSVLLLSREARYKWKHGIPACAIDLVRSAEDARQIEAIPRSIRLSITIRSMLPGADVVGG